MKGLLSVLGPDGRVLRQHAIAHWPLSLGRAWDNDLVLDDPFVAPHHARLEADGDSGVCLVVGDTVNGVRLGRQVRAAGERVPLPAAGAELALGELRLRLRLPGETLPPEQPLHRRGRGAHAGRRSAALPYVLMALLLAADALGSHALLLDPGARASDWYGVVLGLPLALAGWCGAWALASKLFRHRFDFWGHAAVALPWLVAMVVVGDGLPMLAAAAGWPWLWRVAQPLVMLLLVLLLRAHLLLVLPGHARAATASVAALAAIWAGVTLTGVYRATDRLSAPPYMSTLPGPIGSWEAAVPSEQLIDRMQPLADGLAERVREAAAEEAEGRGTPSADDGDDED